MSHKIRMWIPCAGSLLGGLCLLTQLGCVAIVLPLSPPTQTATSMMQQAPGALGVDAGFSPTLSLGTAPGLVPQNFTGLVPLSVRYGLSDGLDITGTWGARPLLGRLGGVQVGKILLKHEPWKVGLTLGLAAYHQAGSFNTEEPVLDADGNPVLDAEGQPVTEEVSHSYAALGLAPSVGARVNYTARDNLHVVGGLRLAYSQTFNLEGDQPTMTLWTVDPELGVVFTPLTGLDLGLGLSLSWPMLPSSLETGVALLPTFSLSYSFPLPGGEKR